MTDVEHRLAGLYCKAVAELNSIEQWKNSDWTTIPDGERQMICEIWKSCTECPMFDCPGSSRESVKPTGKQVFDRAMLGKVGFSQEKWRMITSKLIVLFQGFRFIKSEDPTNLEDATQLFKCWCQAKDPERAYDFLFEEILRMLLRQETEFPKELLLYTTKWYATAVSAPSKFGTFAKLMEMCVSCEECVDVGLAEATRVIDQGLKEKCTNELLSKIMELSETAIMGLNKNGFVLLASISRWSTGKLDKLLQLYAAVCDNIIAFVLGKAKVDTGFEAPKKTESFSITIPEFSFDFVDRGFSRLEYEAGTDFGQIPTPEDVLGRESIDLLDAVVTLVTNCSEACRRVFIETFQSRVTKASEKEFLCLETSLIYVLTKVANDVIVNNNIDLMTSNMIFTGDQCVYLDETLDLRMSMLRTLIFARLTKSDTLAACVKNILIRDSDHLLLFVEHLGRILLVTKSIGKLVNMEIVRHILHHALELQNIESKYNRARSTVFLFLDRIVETDYFYQKEFFAMYSQFLFEKGLAPVILDKITQRCFNLSWSQCFNVVSRFACIIRACRDKLSSEDHLNLVKSLTIASGEVMKRNLKSIANFLRLLPLILDAVLISKSCDLLMAFLDCVIISRISSFEGLYHLPALVSLCRECPEEQRIFDKLLDLLGTWQDKGTKKQWVYVDRPEMMIFVTAYAYTRANFFQLLVLLCESTYNIKKFHECGLDLLLLKFLDQENAGNFMFQGFVFSPKLTSDIEESIVEILERMLSVVCSRAVANCLVTLSNVADSPTRKLLQKLIARSTYQPKNIFCIGSDKGLSVSMKLEKNETIMIAMNVKFDFMSVGTRQYLACRLYDRNKEAHFLSLYARVPSRSMFVTETIWTVVTKAGESCLHGVAMAPQEWVSLIICVSHDKTSIQIRTCASVSNQEITTGRKFWSSIVFSTSAEEESKNRECGVMANFVIRTIQNEEEAEEVVKSLGWGGSPTDLFDVGKLQTKNFGIVKLPLGAYMTLIKDIDFFSIFLQMLKMQRNTGCFVHDGIKTADIRSIPLLKSPNSSVYFCCVELFDIMNEKTADWFKDVITNWTIWCTADLDSQRDILSHWCAWIPINYPEQIQPNFFSLMLIQFDRWAATCANPELKHLFCLFLTRIAHIRLEPDDQRALLTFICSATSTDLLRTYLEMALVIAKEFDPNVTEEYACQLLSLAKANLDSLAIVELALAFIARGPFQFDTMVLAYFILSLGDAGKQLFPEQTWRSQVVFEPSLVQLFCFFAWQIQPETRAVIPSTAPLISTQEVTSGNLWYIWPLLLGREIGQNSVLHSIAQGVKSLDEVCRIVAFMTVCNNNTTGEEFLVYEFLRDVVSGQTKRSVDFVMGIAQICVEQVIVHSTAYLYSPQILDIMEETYGTVSEYGFQMKRKEKLAELCDLEALVKSHPNATHICRILPGEPGEVVNWPIIELARQLLQSCGSENYRRTVSTETTEQMVKALMTWKEKKQNPEGIKEPPGLMSVMSTYTCNASGMDVIQDIIEDIDNGHKVIALLPGFVPDINNRAAFSAKNPPLRTGADTTHSEGTSLVPSRLLCRGYPAKLRPCKRVKYDRPSGKITSNCKLEYMTSKGLKSVKCQVVLVEAQPASMQIKTGKFEWKIPISSGTYAVRTTSKGYELYTLDGRDISLSDMSSQLAKKFDSLFPKSLQWTWKSNFQFVLECNRRAGLSFNRSDFYPIFPGLLQSFNNTKVKVFAQKTMDTKQAALPYHKVTNLQETLTGSRAVCPEFYCFPEVIKGALPEWASSPYELVYGLRKLLEGLDVLRFQTWLSAYFFGKNAPFKIEDKPNKTMVKLGKDEVKTIPGPLFHAYGWSNYTAIVRSGVYQEVFETPDAFQQNLSFTHVFEYNGDARIYANQNKLYVYDRRQTVITSLASSPKDSTAIPMRDGLFGVFLGSYIYSGGPSSLRWRNTIHKTNSKVTALVVSEAFRSLVYVLADNSVSFYSLPEFELVKVVQLSEFVVRLLITESWGFVVLQTEEHLYVYNFNGTFVKQAPFNAKIRYWSSFTTLSDFDYIVYADVDGAVRYFEVFYPDKHVDVGTFQDVLSMQYDSVSSTLLIVQADGTLDYKVLRTLIIQ